MNVERAREILDPEHRENYDGMEAVNEACRMGRDALGKLVPLRPYPDGAAQPGSMVCLVNRMRYGGTHADDAPPRQVGGFCQYCGQPLREIGRERFCNNVNCRNRYVSV